MKTYLGIKKENKWSHFSWLIDLGKGITVSYKTGLAHCEFKGKVKNGMIESSSYTGNIKKIGYVRENLSKDQAAEFLSIFHLKNVLWNAERLDTILVKKPKYRDVIYSLAIDAQCAQSTFEDFCVDLGYDTDSRSALETYLACQESGHKLRKLGYSIDRILAWEL